MWFIFSLFFFPLAQVLEPELGTKRYPTVSSVAGDFFVVRLLALERALGRGVTAQSDEITVFERSLAVGLNATTSTPREDDLAVELELRPSREKLLVAGLRIGAGRLRVERESAVVDGEIDIVSDLERTLTR